jgi:hypothetical protein
MTDLLQTPVRPAAATGSTTPGGPSGPASRHRRPRENLAARGRPLLRPAGYFVASRVAMLAVVAVVARLHPKVRIVQAMGTIFDGHWYVLIAQHGYPQRLFNEGDGSRWAFFPGFPVAVRALAEITRLSLPAAAVAAAFAFGLTSALAVWLAVREVCGAPLADRAVLLYVFCPTAYVLSLGYTEGLFVTAAAGCLYALARRSWVLAGLCACVAGFTRDAGVAVILVVVAAALPAAWRGRTWRPVVGAAIAPLGLAAFMAYGWSMVGTPVAFLSSERFWQGQHFVWFRTPLLALLSALRQGPTGSTFVPDALAGAALVLGFLGLWWLDQMTRRPGPGVPDGATVAIPLSWWLYAVGTLLVAFSAYFADSIARYAMVAFPLYVAFAWRLPRRWTGPVVAAMACAQAALLVAVLSPTWHLVVNPIVP